jgi:hypothetical protein
MAGIIHLQVGCRPVTYLRHMDNVCHKSIPVAELLHVNEFGVFELRIATSSAAIAIAPDIVSSRRCGILRDRCELTLHSFWE